MSDSTPFDKTTRKGKEGGLFRECMVSIRSAHIRSDRLQTVLTLTGLFTDKKVYREVLSLFYLATKELELRLPDVAKSASEKELCTKLQTLGYSFTSGYEKDLKTLYGSSWEEDVKALYESNSAVRTYVAKIQAMQTAKEIAGAVFALWGALVIGGGAIVMPKAKRLAGPNGVHVFESVTGPGREERRTKFVQTWDSLADKENAKDQFDGIVLSVKECMQCNHDLMSSTKRIPWWLIYIVVVIVSIILYFPLKGYLHLP